MTKNDAVMTPVIIATIGELRIGDNNCYMTGHHCVQGISLWTKPIQ